MTPNPNNKPDPGNPGNPGIPDASAAQVATTDAHQLVLVKHGKRYVFACPPGGEADLMAQMATLIHDPTNDLTWFDAALLCHQMGQRMGDRLSHLHNKQSA